jgi:hypothetical protein
MTKKTTPSVSTYAKFAGKMNSFCYLLYSNKTHKEEGVLANNIDSVQVNGNDKSVDFDYEEGCKNTYLSVPTVHCSMYNMLMNANLVLKHTYNVIIWRNNTK